MNIEELLNQNESSVLEFKEICPEKNSLTALMCAFANTTGGILLIGIKDKCKRVIGIKNETALECEQRIASWAYECISPSILPVIRIINYKSKVVLSVQVDTGYQKPYRISQGKFSGKTFVRIGSSTRSADLATEEHLKLQSMGIPPDTLPVITSTKSDLEKEIIKEFLSLRHQMRNIEPPKRITDEWLIKNKFLVNLQGKLKPTTGGLLLFNKKPQEFLDFAGIEMARFKGVKPKDFIDKKSVNGPLWTLYDKSFSFVQRHLFISAQRDAGLRQEKLVYPKLAFREFMINAICHRMYTQGTSTIKLAIFDDIIEITNPGTLPNGLELADMGTGISVIRNPVIARAFNEIGLIEGWGTGITIAQSELTSAGLPKAKINLKGFFTQISSIWRWSDNLPSKEQVIIQDALKRGSTNSIAVMNSLKCSERTARNMLSRLVNKGLLVKEGTTKGTTYLPS